MLIQNFLNTLLLDYNIVINLLFFVFSLFFVYINFSVQKLFYGFIFYLLVHNMYGFLVFFHTNANHFYPLLHSSGQPLTDLKIFDIKSFFNPNEIRYVLIFGWILIINYYLIREKKIKNIIGFKLIQKNFFLFFICLLWMISSIYTLYNNADGNHLYRYWLVKLLIFNIFICTYYFIKSNVSNCQVYQSWFNPQLVFFKMSFFMIALTFFEFFVININTLETVKCISFADMHCVLRPTASLFNPNTLGVFFILMIIGLTGFNLIKNKLCTPSILIYSLATVCLFLTGSRTSILIIIIFHFFLIIFQLFYSRQYIIKTLITAGVVYFSFLMMAIIGKIRLFNASFNNVLELLSDRWYLLPIHIFNIIVKLLNNIIKFINEILGLIIEYSNYIISFTTVKKIPNIQNGLKIPNIQNDLNTLTLNLNSYSDRVSSDSTDNTFVMIFRDEGIFSFLILVSILLYFAFSCLILYLKDYKIYYLFGFCVVASLSFMFVTLNIFANFPIFIFVAIFLGALFFLLKKEENMLLLKS